MSNDSRLILPRDPADPDNLQALREKALARLKLDEESSPDNNARPSRPSMLTVYGGPPPRREEPPDPPQPAPVYGGPPPSRPDPAPVYGGPPTSWWKKLFG